MSNNSSKDNPSRDELYYEEEFTLKDLILKIKEYLQVLWSSKLLLLITALVFAGILFYSQFKKPNSYTSGMTFMVTETDNKSGMQTLAPFEQFQFEEVKENKITEIARASRIVRQVLSSKVDPNSQELISEKILKTYDLEEAWGVKEDFTKDDQLNKLHEFLVGNKISGRAGLMNITFNRVTDLFTLKVVSINPELSSVLAQNFYDSLSEFYIEKTVGRYQKSFGAIVSREDSLRIELNKTENNLAYSADRTRGVVSSVAKVNQSRIQRKFEDISEEYNEAKSNRQRVQNILQNETPDFQIIDKTYAPIVKKPAPMQFAFVGGMLGFFLASGFALLRYIIKQALAA